MNIGGEPVGQITEFLRNFAIRALQGSKISLGTPAIEMLGAHIISVPKLGSARNFSKIG
jgi:hypothetical protein